MPLSGLSHDCSEPRATKKYLASYIRFPLAAKVGAATSASPFRSESSLATSCASHGPGTIPYALRCYGRPEEVKQEDVMGRGLLLWLLGIPIPIIILIWVLGGLHG
jgi:hypothetical protein